MAGNVVGARELKTRLGRHLRRVPATLLRLSGRGLVTLPTRPAPPAARSEVAALRSQTPSAKIARSGAFDDRLNAAANAEGLTLIAFA